MIYSASEYDFYAVVIFDRNCDSRGRRSFFHLAFAMRWRDFLLSDRSWAEKSLCEHVSQKQRRDNERTEILLARKRAHSHATVKLKQHCNSLQRNSINYFQNLKCWWFEIKRNIIKQRLFFKIFEYEDKKLNKKIKLCDPSLTALENYCKSLSLVQDSSYFNWRCFKNIHNYINQCNYWNLKKYFNIELEKMFYLTDFY